MTDKCSSNVIREGFWKGDFEPDLPMPNPRVYPWNGQSDFVDKLRTVELTAECIQFRGWSTCRLCGCWNESREFRAEDAVWPKGLMHYIVEHNVLPSLEFREFIAKQSAAAEKS